MRCTLLERPFERFIRLGARAAVSASLAAALLPQLALAQAACTEIENDTERLACYDRALRPTRPARQAPAPTAAAPAPAAPAAAAQDAAPPASSSSELSTARTVETRRSRSARLDAAAAAPGSPSAPGNAGEADEVVPIVIVRVREIPGRNDRAFTTDNGVVWLQTDNAKLKLPETPFNAEIKPGAMGSFFLVTENRNRAIRVRRQN